MEKEQSIAKIVIIATLVTIVVTVIATIVLIANTKFMREILKEYSVGTNSINIIIGIVGIIVSLLAVVLNFVVIMQTRKSIRDSRESIKIARETLEHAKEEAFESSRGRVIMYGCVRRELPVIVVKNIGKEIVYDLNIEEIEKITHHQDGSHFFNGNILDTPISLEPNGELVFVSSQNKIMYGKFRGKVTIEYTLHSNRERKKENIEVCFGGRMLLNSGSTQDNIGALGNKIDKLNRIMDYAVKTNKHIIERTLFESKPGEFKTYFYNKVDKKINYIINTTLLGDNSISLSSQEDITRHGDEVRRIVPSGRAEGDRCILMFKEVIYGVSDMRDVNLTEYVIVRECSNDILDIYKNERTVSYSGGMANYVQLKNSYIEVNFKERVIIGYEQNIDEEYKEALNAVLSHRLKNENNVEKLDNDINE